MIQIGADGDAQRYGVTFTPQRSGPLAVAVRVRPARPQQILPVAPLVRWA
jgi:hypothetical protein